MHLRSVLLARAAAWRAGNQPVLGLGIGPAYGQYMRHGNVTYITMMVAICCGWVDRVGNGGIVEVCAIERHAENILVSYKHAVRIQYTYMGGWRGGGGGGGGGVVVVLIQREGGKEDMLGAYAQSVFKTKPK
jgi:hypothetical protein